MGITDGLDLDFRIFADLLDRRDQLEPAVERKRPCTRGGEPPPDRFTGLDLQFEPRPHVLLDLRSLRLGHEQQYVRRRSRCRQGPPLVCAGS